MGWRGPMTHRQFTAWVEWRRRQWNEPSRADHYQMQASQTAIFVASGFKGQPPPLDRFKIPFVFGDERPDAGRRQPARPPQRSAPTDAEVRARSKALIAKDVQALGGFGEVEVVTITRSELRRRQEEEERRRRGE